MENQKYEIEINDIKIELNSISSLLKSIQTSVDNNTALLNQIKSGT
jgi:hypothetical protein